METKDVVCSEKIHRYFKNLKEDANICYNIASEARSKNEDPETVVEIPQAEDLAARVEKLVGPEGISKRIRELSKEMDREELSIEIAKEIANREFKSDEKALDQAIRTALAVLTEGVLVAPLEGVADVKIKRNHNGTSYANIYFAGPIRAAGGTAQAMSVLIADVVRRELGLSEYIPTPNEIERYKEEIPLYREAQHLQYTPTAKEVELIVSHCPVCIDGEGTEEKEISGNRDLPRVETNRIRGGACLVIAEGLCLKAPKILKHVHNLNIDGWEFIERFTKKDDDEDLTKSDKIKILPNPKYMKEVLAGRPVFCSPSKEGGFRLRYGRGRNTGIAAIGLNPATMYILDDFIAVGTQVKIERPGKAGAIAPCDKIEGTIVLLENGSLVQINNIQDAFEVKENIKEIIDLGELLIPYGEFLENNHLLVQGNYSFEWWKLDIEKKIGKFPDEYENINSKIAFEISEKLGVPLHPDYNLFWHDIEIKDIEELIVYISENGKYDKQKLILPKSEKIKEILIILGALHSEIENNIVLEKYAYPIIRCCGLNEKLERTRNSNNTEVIKYVTELANIHVRKRSPTRIGARMGRPEKAKERLMKPAPHVLFPLGDFGGKQRLVKEALSVCRLAKKESEEQHFKGGNLRIREFKIDVGQRVCDKCGKGDNYLPKCECGGHTKPTGKTGIKKIDFEEVFNKACQNLGEIKIYAIKGVQGTISKNKTPECLEKGILRAKHNVSLFKDGTIRFDLTDMPLTHFKPKEIGISIEKLFELGYTHDYLGNQIENSEQIIELKVQDLIPSKNCGEYLLKVSYFIDDLLTKLYKQNSFYNTEKFDDLIGHLVIGLAPHTSGGVLGRIIGFTKAHVCYAHPYYHAAKRRNCDGDEDSLMLLLDGLLNFSRSYLPGKRGGLMDAPLVLTIRIEPDEIDKEALNLDMGNYPIEFYEATIKNTHPKEIESFIDKVGDRVGKDCQYEDFKFSHDTMDIGEGPKLSAYKTLGSMIEKMDAQLNLARKIRAVSEDEVASRVISTHFLPDLIGNLRAFSKQTVRCVKCNAKYRRIPLKGVCTQKKGFNVCGGKLTLTVHEGGVRKYMKVTKEVLDRYDISNYTKQRVLLIEKSITSTFENDKVKQIKIEDFF